MMNHLCIVIIIKSMEKPNICTHKILSFIFFNEKKIRLENFFFCIQKKKTFIHARNAEKVFQTFFFAKFNICFFVCDTKKKHRHYSFNDNLWWDNQKKKPKVNDHDHHCHLEHHFYTKKVFLYMCEPLFHPCPYCCCLVQMNEWQEERNPLSSTPLHDDVAWWWLVCCWSRFSDLTVHENIHKHRQNDEKEMDKWNEWI